MPNLSLNSTRVLIQAIGNHLSGIKHYAKMLTEYPVDGCLVAFQLRIEFEQQQAMKSLAELATLVNKKD